MGYLGDTFDQLKVNLPSNWTDQFKQAVSKDDDNDKDFVADIQLRITTPLNPALNAFYDSINFSILSGEYVTNIAEYKAKLLDLEKYVRNDVANVDLQGFPKITGMMQEFVETNFFRPVHDSLLNYQLLLDFVERHLVYKQNTSTIFHLLKDEVQIGKETDSTTRDMALLFRLNVKIAEVDHSISLAKKDFTDLLLCRDRLKTLTIGVDYSGMLLKKCEFLLYKLSFRLQESQQNYLYAIDFNYSAVEPKEVSDFEPFNTIIKGHYDNGIKSIQFKNRLTDAMSLFEQNKLLSFDHYHALTKYFKDNTKDITKLRELRNQYKNFYERAHTNENLFNQKALDITFCYLENNILSIELQLGEFNLDNWQIKLKDYTDRADKFKNKNFFPYYKIIKEFLRIEIPKLFVRKSNTLLQLEPLIQHYEKNLKSLIKNVGICEETDYMTFQNDYEGCKLTIHGGENIPRECFIASSYVLPLNYKELKEELEIYKAELNKFKSMVAIQQMTDADRKDIEKVKEDIEKADKRHIEILSIFAALVMFVSNTVQIFSRTAKFTDAVAYTLFFAFALGLFVLMIWSITRPDGLLFKELKFTHKFVFILFTIGSIAPICYLFVPKNKHEQMLENMQFKIDSLKKTSEIQKLMPPLPNNKSSLLKVH